MKEQWKDIKGYEGYYQVSNTGKVKKMPLYVKTPDGYEKVSDEKHITPICQSTGYPQFHLSKKNARKKNYLASRLVAEHFLENNDPENMKYVMHIDKNLENNSVENLRWANMKEVQKRKHNRQGKKVIQYDENRKIVAKYDSAKDAAEKNEYIVTSIRKACKHFIKYKDFYWEYE